MSILAWSALAVTASGLLHLRADRLGLRGQTYLFKPLTLLFILGLAWLAGPGAGHYRLAVLAALVFSLLGDIVLMLPGRKLPPALASFLIAHVLYIAAFTLDLAWPPVWHVLPWLAWAVGLYAVLGSRLGSLRVAGSVYMLSLLAMSWLAFERWLEPGPPGAAAALLGGLFFVVSDTALACDRFRRPFAWSQSVILPTYYAAQWLMACSVYLLANQQPG